MPSQSCKHSCSCGGQRPPGSIQGWQGSGQGLPIDPGPVHIDARALSPFQVLDPPQETLSDPGPWGGCAHILGMGCCWEQVHGHSSAQNKGGLQPGILFPSHTYVTSTCHNGAGHSPPWSHSLPSLSLAWRASGEGDDTVGMLTSVRVVVWLLVATQARDPRREWERCSWSQKAPWTGSGGAGL